MPGVSCSCGGGIQSQHRFQHKPQNESYKIIRSWELTKRNLVLRLKWWNVDAIALTNAMTVMHLFVYEHSFMCPDQLIAFMMLRIYGNIIEELKQKFRCCNWRTVKFLSFPNRARFGYQFIHIMRKCVRNECPQKCERQKKGDGTWSSLTKMIYAFAQKASKCAYHFENVCHIWLFAGRCCLLLCLCAIFFCSLAHRSVFFDFAVSLLS